MRSLRWRRDREGTLPRPDHKVFARIWLLLDFVLQPRSPSGGGELTYASPLARGRSPAPTFGILSTFGLGPCFASLSASCSPAPADRVPTALSVTPPAFWCASSSFSFSAVVSRPISVSGYSCLLSCCIKSFRAAPWGACAPRWLFLCAKYDH